MGVLLVVALTISSPAPKAELEVDKKAQQAIMKLLIQEYQRIKDRVNLPGCPYDEGDKWIRGLACV